MVNLLLVLVFHRGCPPDYTDWSEDMWEMGFWGWLKWNREHGLSRYPWEPKCHWELEHATENGFCKKCNKKVE